MHRKSLLAEMRHDWMLMRWQTCGGGDIGRWARHTRERHMHGERSNKDPTSCEQDVVGERNWRLGKTHRLRGVCTGK